jgi:hypothetical protein
MQYSLGPYNTANEVNMQILPKLNKFATRVGDSITHGSINIESIINRHPDIKIAAKYG